MRHKYDTRAITLARTSIGEANALLALLTRDMGLVRARAQGLRKSGAKLAAALATWSESDVVLVKGAEGWRVTGAVLREDRFAQLPAAAREGAGRVSGLLLRLAGDDASDPGLFELFSGYLDALTSASVSDYDALEILAALRLLALLGFDAGELPDAAAPYGAVGRTRVLEDRSAYVVRVNRGIEASGL